MNAEQKFLVGIYDDEDILLHAIQKVRKEGVKIHEVYSPFPVHGIDDALGYKRSRLPIAAFMFGLLGTSLALFMQIWMLGIDWPMIIGGKDYVPLPTFIPVTFELTVLLASLGMVATFFVASDLKPYGKARIFDLRSTDDKHVMAVDLAKNKLTPEQLRSILTDSGASEVNDKIFD
jgi:hypothetical protein